MKKIIFLFALIINGALAQTPVLPQRDVLKVVGRYGFDLNHRPVVEFNFYFDPQNSVEKQDFYLSIAVQNDYLQFTKKNNGFYSDYMISCLVKDPDTEDILFSQTWQASLTLNDFNETNSRSEYQQHHYKVHLADRENFNGIPKSKYQVFVEVRDVLSSRVYKSFRTFSYSAQGPKEIPPPSVAILDSASGNIDALLDLASSPDVVIFNKEYRALARFHVDQAESLEVNVRLFSKNQEELDLLAQQFIKITPDSDGVFQALYELPYTKMDEGDYVLRFSALYGEKPVDKECSFSVVWFSKPIYLYKTDLAIRPMQYMLGKELSDSVTALSLPDQETWFKKYWKKFDPDPGTVYNQVMVVFFRRVTETVRLYSTRFKEGWETDRGRVFLRYGKPQEIDDQKLSASTYPHVVWKYHIDGKTLAFTFVDDKGNGEFTLLNQEEE